MAPRWPEGLVAFWDFSEPAPPFRAKAGVGDFPLANGPGADVRTAAGGPFGRAAAFDGVRDYLAIPAREVGALDVAQAGDECTVVAWVLRRATGMHFIAGMWEEADEDPRRQYGLFVSLPLYGGDERVCGHVSRTGDKTPGYPYSRDYSASARRVEPGSWRCIAFTYDGAEIVSYLDGMADPRPTYTDPLGSTYSKNPYVFTEGLNRTRVSEFTVGANRLGAKDPEVHPGTDMGLFLDGLVGGLAVFHRALGAEEIMAIHRASATG